MHKVYMREIVTTFGIYYDVFHPTKHFQYLHSYAKVTCILKYQHHQKICRDLPLNLSPDLVFIESTCPIIHSPRGTCKDAPLIDCSDYTRAIMISVGWEGH
jgi:hypothetical protein